MEKNKENKIFVTGVSGCGKTFYAKQYSEKYNVTYIEFDSIWDYKNLAEDEYKKITLAYTDNFITDAIPYTELNDSLMFLEYYENNKDNIKIICTCCTNKDEWDKRLESKFFKDKNQAYSEFYYFYFNTLKKYYSKLNIEYYDSYFNEFISESELYKRIDWVIKFNLMKYINDQEYDKFYQDIECLDFVGYSKSFNTWENIKNLVDWKDKKVADLGCFHCYFSFKAAKEGAKVTGLDINDNVIKTSKYINEIENNIIEIKKWSGGDEISSDYDIVLCLNVIHHFPDIQKSLNNIKSKIVIFETNQNLIDLISEEFNIIKKISSHRVDFYGNERIILLCEKIK